MIDLLSLAVDTNAYKTILADKESGRLSHAYLVVCSDGDNLKEYLKILAKLITCGQSEPGKTCRDCTLIDNEAHPDVLFFPKKEGSVVVDDVNELISESHIKPIESERKVFVVCGGETMNLPSQNKLLKTLEEPPKNVHVLIGATSEYPLLQTVKSRLKRVEIPAYSPKKLYSALSLEFTDEERLKNAIACGDGTVGKAVSLYADENLSLAVETAVDTLINMRSSADVLDYSQKISNLKSDINEFLSVLELLLRDVLAVLIGKEELALNSQAKRVVSEGVNFTQGAVVYALDKVNEAYERKKFNANPTMLLEWLLFQILEGKYKWQKS